MSIRIGVSALFVSMMLTGGCAGVTQHINVNEEMRQASHPTTARIHITRKSYLRGGGVTTRVVDSGDGIEKPHLLVEKSPRNRRSRSPKNNVALIEGVEGLVFGKKKYILKYKKTYGENWREQALQRKPGDSDIGAHYTAFIGKVGNGGTIIWERKPGSMHIEVIDGYGYQILGRPTSVEAGKDYYVLIDFFAPTPIRIGETPF